MNSNLRNSNPTAPPCVMVIFGGTGDLTKRKLIPALGNLAEEDLLSKQFAVIGFASNELTTESYRQMLTEEIPKYSQKKIDQKIWTWFTERIYYVKGTFEDAEAYKRLKEQIVVVDKQHNTEGNKFFYLAVAPRFFSVIVKQLGEAGLT